MLTLYVLLGGVGLCLFTYLLIAMLKPELFP